ncbi:MAG: DNA-binding response regulator, partial [Bacteroidota bacterium]|nr:DNA-binding response regulator [Bacteroidota bacterium]
RAEYPHLRILLLSMMTHERTIGEALAAGAHGYVLKSADKYEVVAALQGVASGKRFLCSEIGLGVLEKCCSRSPVTRPRAQALVWP